MLDLLFSGGLVADGSGAPLKRVNVGVSADEIFLTDSEVESGEEIDVSGAIIAPGFIDIHTHSDLTLLSNPLAQSKIRQGVTTEVVGNCGYGVAPNPYKSRDNPLRSGLAFIDVDPSIEWNWHSHSEYMKAIERNATSLNVATLIGHIPIHTAIAGFGESIAKASEITAMKELLRENLASGAFGFSTGLNLTPISYASEEELVALGEVVAEFDGIFAIHMREYGDNLMKSIEEVIRVAEKSGARIQVSHLVALGEKNWGRVEDALERIEISNASGCEINVDVYPYIAGSCPLSQILPDWSQEGGDEQMRKRLKDSKVRLRVKERWDEIEINWENYQIASVFPRYKSMVSKRISAIAQSRNQAPDDLALDLLADMGHAIAIVAFGRHEMDVKTVFAHPLAMVGSDGLSLDPAGPTGVGIPHPRSYGTFPRVLSRYAGAGQISLERAIEISTSTPASKLRICDRGLIKNRYKADLVIFNPNTISDLASYENPHQYPTGILHVVVNGKLVVKNNSHLGITPGKVLRHS